MWSRTKRNAQLYGEKLFESELSGKTFHIVIFWLNKQLLYISVPTDRSRTLFYRIRDRMT